jgi:hypothetical protein
MALSTRPCVLESWPSVLPAKLAPAEKQRGTSPKVPRHPRKEMRGSSGVGWSWRVVRGSHWLRLGVGSDIDPWTPSELRLFCWRMEIAPQLDELSPLLLWCFWPRQFAGKAWSSSHAAHLPMLVPGAQREGPISTYEHSRPCLHLHILTPAKTS